MRKHAKPSPKLRNVSTELRNTARALRHTMTPAEATLWEAIQDNKLAGLKFRRQHPLEKFILDFYCALHRLVIEVDGPIHDEQQEHDAERTQILESLGYRVLRFRNEEVLHNLPDVLKRIITFINENNIK
jgi:very-short-patch-repair endonuclease